MLSSIRYRQRENIKLYIFFQKPLSHDALGFGTKKIIKKCLIKI